MLKRIYLWLSTSLLLQACSSIPGVVEPPKVNIENVQLQGLSLTQGTAMVTLNVSNPNAFPIPLQAIEYGLSLNGRQVARGARTQSLTLAARQDIPVTVPVKLDFMELLRLAPEVLRSGRVNYDLSGAVKLPLISVPFQRQGGIGIKP